MYKCNAYSSCTECVSSLFPCDWCVNGHRCTHDSAVNCRNDLLINGINRLGSSFHGGPSLCPRITSVESQEIRVSSGTNKSIEVKVDNFATLITQTRFVCEFNIDGSIQIVNARLQQDLISCDHMDFSYKTSAPSTNAKLSVLWGESKPLDNPDNIHVLMYKCNAYSSCTECVSSPYPCDWCVDGHRCTHDSRNNCRNDVLVNGINKPSSRRGPLFCPRISLINSQEILAPSGTIKFIRVEADNIAQFIIQSTFECQFNIEGRVSSVNAQLHRNTIYCDPMEFSVSTAAPLTNATFAVIWGGSKPLDNPDNIYVLVYKCHLMEPAFLLARNLTCPSINT